MDLEIPAALVAQVAQWVTRVVPARPTVPILAGVRLRCIADQLVAEASDLDRTFCSRVPCVVAEEGQVIVAGKLFAEVAGALPSAVAHCWSTESEFVVECEGLEYRFIRLSEQEYPALEPAPEPIGTIDGDAFATAVNQVAPATGRDELLPVFTGIHIRVDDDEIALSATDRYRMATTRVDWHPSRKFDPAEFVVPAKLLAGICRPGEVPDRYQIGWGGGAGGDAAEHIGVRSRIGDESRDVRARLLSGRFPSMTPILNVATGLTLWLRTDELQTAVHRVRLTAEQRSAIQLSIEAADTLVVSGASAGRATGKAIVSLPAIEGDTSGSHQLAFNPEYLLDALNTYPTEFLQIRISEPKLTAILHGAVEPYEPTTDDHSHVVKLMHPQR